MARDCAIERKTVSNYFQVLEDLLIGYRIPVFSKRAKRRLISHSKFFFFDVGVFRTIRPSSPLDRHEEISGAALETLVFLELRAVNDYFRLQYTIFFWRTSAGAEVDFVLYGPRGIIAIVVKHAGRVSSRDLKQVRSFKTDYPEATCFLFYMGNRKKYYDDIRVIPVEEALPLLPRLL